MKKLFSAKLFPIFIVVGIIFSFFIPQLSRGNIPIPADTLVGLYHPFRDNTYNDYSPGKYPVKNPYITDPILQTYPWKKLVIDNFKNLQWPLWNPYSFSGQPLLANIQSAPFEITNLLFFILPFNLAWTIHIILPSILAGLFMYLFLRELGLKKLSSIYGGIVFPFSGYFIVWLTWGGITLTAMYLPLALYTLSKLLNKLSPGYFLLLVFIFSQIILSGHWQTASYIFLAIFIFMILKINQVNKRKILILIFGIVLGVGISAAQILPSLEFLDLSSRDFDQSYYPGREDWFLPFQHLIQIVSPDFFGNPTTANYWGVFNYAEFVSYVGILPLTLAIIALIKIKKNYIFLLVIALVALLFALKNPISLIPFNLNIPFISSMQPSRIIFILMFALSALSAIGIDMLIKDKFKKIYFLAPIFILSIIGLLIIITQIEGFLPDFDGINTSKVAFRNLIIPFALSLVFIILLVISRLKSFKNYVLLAIIFITLLELFRFGHKFLSFSNVDILYPSTKITSVLKDQSQPYRVISTDRRIFHPNISITYNIESVMGYDPLFLNDYAKLITSWESNTLSKPGSFNRIVTPSNINSPITDLLNIKYVMSFDEITNPKWGKIASEGSTKLYENNNVLPRVFFVQEIVKTDSVEGEIQGMLTEDFNAKLKSFSSEFYYPKTDTNSEAVVKKFNDQSMTIIAKTDIQAPLLISNVNYPGWKATINGNSAEIINVNFMFQSLLVPAGEHTISLKYAPDSFYNGLLISMISVFITIAAYIYLWKKKLQ